MLETIKKGSRTQEYRKAHQKFLENWAKGLDPLEIALLLGLSKAQLAKHTLQAFEEQAERTSPTYGCILWEDLPQAVRRVFSGEKGQICRVEGDASGVTITKSTIGAQQRV